MQAEELVSKIKLLYTTGIMGFIHHLENTACKVTEKQRNRKIGMLDEQVQEWYQDTVLTTIMDAKLTMEKKQSEMALHKTKTISDIPHQQFEEIKE